MSDKWDFSSNYITYTVTDILTTERLESHQVVVSLTDAYFTTDHRQNICERVRNEIYKS